MYINLMREMRISLPDALLRLFVIDKSELKMIIV